MYPRGCQVDVRSGAIGQSLSPLDQVGEFGGHFLRLRRAGIGFRAEIEGADESSVVTAGHQPADAIRPQCGIRGVGRRP